VGILLVKSVCEDNSFWDLNSVRVCTQLSFMLAWTVALACGLDTVGVGLAVKSGGIVMNSFVISDEALQGNYGN